MERPRFRRKGQGEDGKVPVPAYEAMRREENLGARILGILLRRVSSRQYRAVLPEIAETVGVLRSSVSRMAMEASEEELKQLSEQRLEELGLLVLYLDGVTFGDHRVLMVGVDREGLKHVLGIAEASLREGLAEMFTVNRPGLSPGLMRCQVSTNAFESLHSGVRLRTRRICRWRDVKMVLRWAAAALLMTEKNFRRIMGYRVLWMLKAILEPC